MARTMAYLIIMGGLVAGGEDGFAEGGAGRAPGPGRPLGPGGADRATRAGGEMGEGDDVRLDVGAGNGPALVAFLGTGPPHPAWARQKEGGGGVCGGRGRTGRSALRTEGGGSQLGWRGGARAEAQEPTATGSPRPASGWAVGRWLRAGAEVAAAGDGRGTGNDAIKVVAGQGVGDPGQRPDAQAPSAGAGRRGSLHRRTLAVMDRRGR